MIQILRTAVQSFAFLAGGVILKNVKSARTSWWWTANFLGIFTRPLAGRFHRRRRYQVLCHNYMKHLASLDLGTLLCMSLSPIVAGEIYEFPDDWRIARRIVCLWGRFASDREWWKGDSGPSSTLPNVGLLHLWGLVWIVLGFFNRCTFICFEFVASLGCTSHEYSSHWSSVCIAFAFLIDSHGPSSFETMMV